MTLKASWASSFVVHYVHTQLVINLLYYVNGVSKNSWHALG